MKPMRFLFYSWLLVATATAPAFAAVAFSASPTGAAGDAPARSSSYCAEEKTEDGRGKTHEPTREKRRFGLFEERLNRANR